MWCQSEDAFRMSRTSRVFCLRPTGRAIQKLSLGLTGPYIVGDGTMQNRRSTCRFISPVIFFAGSESGRRVLHVLIGSNGLSFHGPANHHRQSLPPPGPIASPAACPSSAGIDTFLLFHLPSDSPLHSTFLPLPLLSTQLRTLLIRLVSPIC